MQNGAYEQYYTMSEKALVLYRSLANRPNELHKLLPGSATGKGKRRTSDSDHSSSGADDVAGNKLPPVTPPRTNKHGKELVVYQPPPRHRLLIEGHATVDINLPGFSCDDRFNLRHNLLESKFRSDSKAIAIRKTNYEQCYPTVLQADSTSSESESLHQMFPPINTQKHSLTQRANGSAQESTRHEKTPQSQVDLAMMIQAKKSNMMLTIDQYSSKYTSKTKVELYY